ncbi:MAG: L-fuculose-phosphate aldolase, partial [Solirubrobacteraceae bacterium]|nr:L-fuculose-phosphate aldolase [Solirubrobacteraceae bacterium]
LACVLDELPVIHYQMLLLGGSVRVAPYETFGSTELAEATLEALQDRTAALMANHGAIVHGANLDVAMEQTLLLEWACGVYWHASALGQPRILDQDQQQGVVDTVIRTGYGTQSAR